MLLDQGMLRPGRLPGAIGIEGAQGDHRHGEGEMIAFGQLVGADLAGGIGGLASQRVGFVDGGVLGGAVGFAGGGVHEALHPVMAGRLQEVQGAAAVGRHIEGRGDVGIGNGN